MSTIYVNYPSIKLTLKNTSINFGGEKIDKIFYNSHGKNNKNIQQNFEI